MRLSGIVLPVFCVLATVNIAAAEQIDRAKLIGSWSFGSDAMSQKFTFADDGTFHSEMAITLQGATQKKVFSGVWTLDGNQLHMTIKKSDPPGGAGRELQLLVKDVSADHATFVDPADDPPSPTVYKRVKE
jgi:hypothetical protein